MVRRLQGLQSPPCSAAPAAENPGAPPLPTWWFGASGLRCSLLWYACKQRDGHLGEALGTASWAARMGRLASDQAVLLASQRLALCVPIAKDVLREVLAAASTRSSSRGPVAASWEL